MKASNKRRVTLTPDITPLIDVLFILLIFFMVTSVFNREEATLLLTLPKTQFAQEQTKNDLRVLLELRKDKLAINKKVMEFKEFENFCQNVSDPSLPVEVRVDRDVTYDRVVRILEILQKYGLSNLSLMTKKKQ